MRFVATKVEQGLTWAGQHTVKGWTKVIQHNINGWSKISEYYSYARTKGAKAYGNDLGTILYGDRKEQSKLVRRYRSSKNPVTRFGRWIGANYYNYSVWADRQGKKISRCLFRR